MTQPTKTIVELIDYRSFRNDRRGRPRGLAILKVTNGLTVNYVTEHVYGFNFDENGQIKVESFGTLSAVEYNLSSEILVCLDFLQGDGWIDPSAKIVITIDDLYKHDVRVTNWSKTPTSTDTIGDFLGDVVRELAFEGQEFTPAWYCAKICDLYFQRYPVEENTALTIGILLSQMCDLLP